MESLCEKDVEEDKQTNKKQTNKQTNKQKTRVIPVNKLLTITTYVEELVHFLPVLCLASSNQYQLALEISKVIQGEVILGQLLPCVLQFEMDHIMDAVDCLCALGTHLVMSICQDVYHLPKGGDLN